MKNFKSMSALLLATALVSCSGNKPAETHEAYRINKFENDPYVAEVWWGQDYDEAAAVAYLDGRFHYLDTVAATSQEASAIEQETASSAATEQPQGLCSSWRKGDYHGRNIDWTMQDFVSLVIHMPKIGDHHAWVGVIAGASSCNKDLVDQNEMIPEQMRAYLPTMVVDGINDCGVCINHNIVPYDQKLKPAYAETGDIVSSQLVAHVLSNCATAAAAVEEFQNHTKVAQSIVKIAHDYSHFLLSDPTESYVLEWVNNEYVATRFTRAEDDMFRSANGNPAIMTNFFVAEGEKYGVGTQEFYVHHPMAAGVERYNVIAEMLPAAQTEEDHMNICRAVWYKPFCEGDRFWPTENAGNYGLDTEKGKAYWYWPTPDDIHYMETDSIYAAAVEMLGSEGFQSYFVDFKANHNKLEKGNGYWYTQHSVVFNIKERSCAFIGMEGQFCADIKHFTVD